METIAWNEPRYKKGKSLDAVPMTMSKEHGGFHWHRFEQLIAQQSQTRAAIKNQAFVTYPDFDAGCIAPIADRIFSGGGYLTSNAPELKDKIICRASYHICSSIRCTWWWCHWLKVWHLSMKLAWISNTSHQRISIRLFFNKRTEIARVSNYGLLKKGQESPNYKKLRRVFSTKTNIDFAPPLRLNFQHPWSQSGSFCQVSQFQRSQTDLPVSLVTDMSSGSLINVQFEPYITALENACC